MYGYSGKPSKFKKFMQIFLLMIIVSVGSIFVYSIYTKIDVKNYNFNENTTATRLYNNEGMEEKQKDFTEILEETTKGVVGISKIKNTGTAILDLDATQELGLGSGVIVSNNGYILTNWHVAGNKYSTCYVTVESGEKYNGNVVWADEDLDLAIVKINASSFDYIELGDSDSIKLGQDVWAIGNPIGIEFQRTVTSGIISGLDRTIKVDDSDKEAYMEDLIQTDASINSGNSGGPLINSQGQVIGINTVKITSAEGIGFAIPINIIKPVLEGFIQNDKFEEAYLGIFAYDKEVNKYLNLSENFNNGIYVVKIATDGPAVKSGLKVKDLITKIDDKEINKMSELRNYIYTKKPGDKVTLTVDRNSKEYNIEITLGKR